VLSHLQFAFENCKDVVFKRHSEGFDWQNEPTDGRPSMPAEAEKQIDGEMQCFV
jgi:hypothetical protein